MRTLKIVVVAGIAVGAAMAAVPAFAGTWDGAYDGKIVSTYTDGRWSMCS